MDIPEKYADDIAAYKRRVPARQYRRMCKWHDEHRLKQANREIPSEPTAIGSRFVDQIGAAPLHREIVPIEASICDDALPFAQYGSNQQEKIFKQLKSENSQCDIETKSFVFHTLAPNILPITSIEYDLYDPHIRIEDIETDFKKVDQIASRITQKGFDSAYPIVSVYADQPFPSLNLYGGHHRLQAVRNLMHQKQLPSNTTVPVIVVCPLNQSSFDEIPISEEESE